MAAALDRLMAVSRWTDEGCLETTNKPTTAGYGQIRINGKMNYTHRAMWEAVKGPIPAGLVIDHLCRNRLCMNVDHLRLLTRGENVMAEGSESIAAKRAAQTHCVNGHEFTEGNTGKASTGKRRCLACAREQNRRYRAAS